MPETVTIDQDGNVLHVESEPNPKLDKIKTLAKVVVGFSTSGVVGKVIRNNMIPTSGFQRAELWIASTVIGMMVAKAAEETVDDLVDKVAGAVGEGKKAVDEVKKGMAEARNFATGQ